AADDPDVIVIGSSNGVGKTSLLEGICLGMLAQGRRHSVGTQDARRLIHTGAERALLQLDVVLGDESGALSAGAFPEGIRTGPPWEAYTDLIAARAREDSSGALGETLAGRSDNPLVAPPVLYFHSYRKVIPLPLELADIMGPRRPGRTERMSVFKFRVLRTLLAQSDLLEGAETPDVAADVLEQLDESLMEFAGAYRRKLQSGPDDANTLDLLVAQGAEAPSMLFDALSSGQKEIISTPFLVWQATRDFPSVVLIDEPELHLHQEWHDDFMRTLFQLAPQNQYIIATHSQRIARSVERDRLRVLKPQGSDR
ncbi:MAG: ATP-binding protein, partial [Armatimonadetes bacterium]|nr:ATP-binding protein [Armatimonadota bacterium]